MRLFYHILGNVALGAMTNTFTWFALVFWAYLATNSVLVTSVIGGSFLAATALSSLFMGAFVDHHPKKYALILSSIVTLVAFSFAGLIYYIAPAEAFTYVSSPALLALIFTLIVGAVAGNMRVIALSTIVTLVVPEERRANVNGMVGMVQGISFAGSSVVSGLLIGWYGMGVVLALAILLTALILVHAYFLTFPKEHIVHTEEKPKEIDLKGTIVAILAVPGFMMLIFFTTFNNFLGGVFMSLMDAYGLSLMSVETWGLALGVLSFGFIIGGLSIAKFGLGENPLRTLLLANIAMWATCIWFVSQPWIWLLFAGMAVYMCLMPIVEATEQTVIQKVIPFERQGRVFGFAQTVEQTASPLTAFMIGPIAQFVFIPFMTTGAGVALIGDWFGTGMNRGIALVFMTAGAIGLVVTIYALNSWSYRALSKRYKEAPTPTGPQAAPAPQH